MLLSVADKTADPFWPPGAFFFEDGAGVRVSDARPPEEDAAAVVPLP